MEHIVCEFRLKLCLEFQLGLVALTVGLKVWLEFEVEGWDIRIQNYLCGTLVKRISCFVFVSEGFPRNV